MERNEFYRELKKTYQQPVTRDVFGRRSALPSEIDQALNPTYETPTPHDLQEKLEGEEQSERRGRGKRKGN